jgi:hypothetical protein
MKQTRNQSSNQTGNQSSNQTGNQSSNQTGNQSGLARLKSIALVFILPGLAGLIVSAMLSGHYLNIMPSLPSPAEMRTVPRNIHGFVVYQTAAEDRRLDLVEYSSVAVFVAGLGLGLVYLEKWGSHQATDEEDQSLPQGAAS